MEDLKDKYKDLFDMAVPELKARQKTFLEIAEMPHYENVDSNILAFFFNKDGEHQLQDLFLRSLVETINSKIIKGSKDIDFIDWTVEREVITSTGTRIDLVIQSLDGDRVIIIENKMYHWLANDLQSYWSHYSKIKDDHKIGIVLSLNPTVTLNENFISITHKELNDAVLRNLQYYYLEANDRFLIYLKDYIDNKNRLYMSETKRQQLLFYFKNSERINELTEIKQHTVSHIYSQIEKAGEKLGFSVGGKRSDRLRHFFLKKGSDYYTDILYFTIFPKDIFSKNGKYKVVLETYGVSEEIQKKLINYLNSIDNGTADVIILPEPVKKLWAHLVTKTYTFSEDQLDNFSSVLVNHIEEDFKNFQVKILPFLLTELGK